MRRADGAVAAGEILGRAVLVAPPADSLRILRMKRRLRHRFHHPASGGPLHMTAVMARTAPRRETWDMEDTRSRVLLAFISAGLLFMLVPGTFLGVWNLVQISSRES